MRWNIKLPRRKFVIGIAIAVSAIALVFSFSTSEPTYQGKGFSEYLPGLSKDGIQVHYQPPYDTIIAFQPSPERDQAWEAVDHAGIEAVPTLVRYASSRDSKLGRIIKAWAEKLPLLHLQFQSAGAKRGQATVAFMILGSRGRSAIPSLLPLLRDPQTVRSAIFALAFLQPQDERAIDELCTVVQNADTFTRVEAMAALAHMGTNAVAAVPAINQQLTLSTNDTVRAMAAVTLVRLGVRTPELATSIATNLSGSSAAPGYPAPSLEMNLWALGEIGGAARHTLSQIARYENDPTVTVRSLAQEAIQRIQDHVEPDGPETGASRIE